MITQPAEKWWADYARNFAVQLAIVVVAAEVFYWLMRTIPDMWWLAITAAYCLMLLITFNKWPQNRYQGEKLIEVSDPELKRRFANLLARAKIPTMGLWVYPISKKSRIVNAWFMGLGPTRRILISDTMLATLSYDEIEAIMAHELAHYAHADLIKQMCLKALYVLVATFALYNLCNFISSITATFRIGDVASLCFLIWFWGIIYISMLNVDGRRSRKAEKAADSYAIELTGNPDAFKSAMLKLADLNLIRMHPHQGKAATSGSHPTMGERVGTADIAAGRPVQPVRLPPTNHNMGWTKRPKIQREDYSARQERTPRVVQRIPLRYK